MLLMGFIQAWRLQARPPHEQDVVNSSPLPPTFLLSASPFNCSREAQVEHESAHLQVVFLIRDALQ